jgi:hypothetical protein
VIADQEFPQSPDSVAEASRLAFEVCALAERTKDDGVEVALGRHRRELGLGDAALEPKGDAPFSLPEVGYNSSSILIRRRVRGRSVEAVVVELLLDEGEPLVGCMASGNLAESVREEQHRTGG